MSWEQRGDAGRERRELHVEHRNKAGGRFARRRERVSALSDGATRLRNEPAVL
jgi:hypothetical protein